jgi:hypothetical protein
MEKERKLQKPAYGEDLDIFVYVRPTAIIALSSILL